ncbi:hypothetical protein [Wenyingzhuangia sp. IMCC45467]
MKKILTLIILILTSCINEEKSEWKKIQNSTKLNDYTKYILDYPKSKYVVNSLNKYQEIHTTIIFPCQRGVNKCNIEFLPNEKLYFEYQNVEINNIDKKIYEFLIDKKTESTSKLAKFKIKNIEIPFKYFEIIYTPKDINKLRKLLFEISKGIIQYEEYISEKYLNKKYSTLNNETKEELRNLSSMMISLYRFDKYILPPPPPPPPVES